MTYPDIISEENVLKALKQTSEDARLGRKIQIIRDKFRPGIIIGSRYDKDNAYFDVLMDSGEKVYDYRAYTGFYPRWDWLD